jgi:hypothetical protein
MSAALRWLGLDAARWERVGPHSLWSATALVVVSSSLLALSRFGGLVTVAPRPFVRLVLVGVWGWIWLAASVWLVATIVARSMPRMPLRTAFATIGLAHVPLLAVAVVVLVAAVMLQLLGPGLVTAVFVVAFWFPAALVTGVAHGWGASIARSAAIVAGPYAVWLFVVADHLSRQVGHLL